MQIFSDYEIGAKLNYHYLNSRPFPHIVLDNFINSNTATQCFNELKTTDHWATESSNNAYMRDHQVNKFYTCLLYTSPSPRDRTVSRMPSSA